MTLVGAARRWFSGMPVSALSLLFLLLGPPALVVAVAGPVSAHAVLESSTPAQGSQVGAAPPDVTLVFSEEVGLTDRSAQVLDASGKRVDQGKPQHADGNPRTIQVSLAAGLGAGSYTVMWRVVSADGHPASGTFSFGVGVPAGATPTSVSVDPLVSAVRFVTQLASYAGTALVVGASTFLFALWPAGQGNRRMRRLLVVACGVALFGAIGTFLAQGPYVSGGTIADMFDTELLGETVTSSYGRPLLLRILAAGLAVPVLGVWPAIDDDEDSGPGGLAAIGTALLLAASFALTGHPAEASPRLFAETADAVHLLAAGVWLGGLVVLFAVFLPEARATLQQAVLARWSALAAGCVGAITLTGLYQAWREVRAVNALPATAYGRLMLGKLVVVLLLLVLGALARRRVVAAGATRASADLRPVVLGEAVAGVVVLGLTTVLVATPPSRVTFGPPFTAALTALDVENRPIRLAVNITPTRTGTQSISIQANALDGTSLSFVAASGQLLPAGGSEAIDVTFLRGKEGQATGSAVVPSSGKWTLTVHVVTDATTDYATAVTYTVR